LVYETETQRFSQEALTACIQFKMYRSYFRLFLTQTKCTNNIAYGKKGASSHDKNHLASMV